MNVGQGDAALLDLGREQALIDGGPDRTVLDGLGRYLPPFDRTIETVMLTHPHDDHLNGLIAAAGRYRIRRLVMDAASLVSPKTAGLVEAVRRGGGEVVIVKAGDVLWFGNRVYGRVLWPPAAMPPLDDQSGNGDSIVLRLVVLPPPERANARPLPLAVLMGDAPIEVEHSILAHRSGTAPGVNAPGTVPSQLSAPIIKIGHHGSRHSTSPEWLEAVRPGEAVISVGRNNYGHPSPLTLKRLETRSVLIRRTDQAGDIIIPIQ